MELKGVCYGGKCTDALHKQHHKHVALEEMEKIVLTEDEEEVVIKRYGKLEQNIKPKADCAIGVGYTTCTDINFKAVDVFRHLQPELDKLIAKGPINLKVHPQITNLREFTETFLYYFSQGANAERVSDDKAIFKMLHKIVVEKGVKHVKEIGGHSAVFARRAQMEGCQVFVAAQATEINIQQIPLNKEKADKYLIWPYSEIWERLQPVEQERQKKHVDTHLVFEYNENDEILGMKAPRSNRFYFVHDPNGAYFQQMEIYHSKVSEHQNIHRHMFGGYQLMQKLHINEAEERLKKQASLWEKMRKNGAANGIDHRIHVEFAHFSSLDFFQLFDKYAVRNADSLGMNEQELIMLLDFWADEIQDINMARDSKPTLSEIIEQLKRFFQIVKVNDLSVSRVHLHPYGSFFMCYDKNKWEDAKDAILKSSLSTPKYCLMQDSLFDSVSTFDIPELPKWFNHPKMKGQRVWTNKESLGYEFELTEDVHCHLQFFLKCRTMVKTAGMGDTISSTGFIYHTPKNASKL